MSKALIKSFGMKYLLLGLVPLLEECVFKYNKYIVTTFAIHFIQKMYGGIRIVQPLCLGLLIQYFTPGSQMSAEEAAIYATGVVLGSFLYNLTHQAFLMSSVHIGMQMRLACCSLLYKKVKNLSKKYYPSRHCNTTFILLFVQKGLRLSQSSIERTGGIGHVINLMSNDVNRVENITTYGHYLIVGPIQAVIMTVVLLFVIGPSCLVGLCVLCLSIPLQSIMRFR